MTRPVAAQSSHERGSAGSARQEECPAHVRAIELKVLLNEPSEDTFWLQQKLHVVPVLYQSVQNRPVSPFRPLNELTLSFQPIHNSAAWSSETCIHAPWYEV
jgi:hypothetical protein